MSRRVLQLNSAKTEVLTLGPEDLRNMFSTDGALLSGIKVPPVPLERGWVSGKSGPILIMSQGHLCNITNVRNIMSQSGAERQFHVFSPSRLDYWDSLLSRCPIKSLKCLQLVQNAAAQVLTRTQKGDHISPVQTPLHWLPVKLRRDFKSSFSHQRLFGVSVCALQTQVCLEFPGSLEVV